MTSRSAASSPKAHEEGRQARRHPVEESRTMENQRWKSFPKGMQFRRRLPLLPYFVTDRSGWNLRLGRRAHPHFTKKKKISFMNEGPVPVCARQIAKDRKPLLFFIIAKESVEG